HWPIKYDVEFSAGPPPPKTVSLLSALNFSRVLAVDAAHRAHTHDADGALDSCLAIQHAAKSMEDDPTLMAHLVRYACTTLAIGAIERTIAQNRLTRASEPGLKRMQCALETELPHETMLKAMRAERAFTHQIFHALVEGRIDANNLMGGVGSIP